VSTHAVDPTNKICILCGNYMIGCRYCWSSTNCDTCTTMYARNYSTAASTCVSCSTAVGPCTRCSFGTQLQCTACVNMSYFFNISGCYLCKDSPLIPNCSVCSNNNSCKQCLSFNYLATNKSCFQCTPNCVLCN
jgi:hypothetical protein